MLQRLQALQTQAKLATAETAFRAMIETTPQHPYAWLGLGCCAWLSGNRAAEEAAFATLLANPVDDENTLAECTSVLGEVGQLDRARQLLQDSWRTSVKLSVALGTMEERAGQFACARDLYKQAIVLDPQAVEAFQKYVFVLLRLGDSAEALAAVDVWAGENPGRETMAWQLRGKIHRAEGATVTAAMAFREGLLLDPASVSLRIDLASELRRLLKFDDAETVLTNAPPKFPILLALSELELARRNHDKASHYAASAHALEARRPEALSMQIRIALDCRDFESARKSLATLVALGPQHCLTAHRRRVDIHRAKGEEIEILTVLQEMGALQPTDANLAAEIARQYRRLGRRNDAEDKLHAARAANPHHVALLAETCEAAIQQDDYATALDIARRLLQAQPDQVHRYLLVTRLLRNLGREDEAQAMWRKTEIRFRRRPEVVKERITRLKQNGELESAYREARAAFEAAPGNLHRWSDLFDLAMKIGSVSDVEQLLTLAPVQNVAENIVVLRAKARFARRRQRYAEAQELLQMALRLSKHDQSTIFELFSLSIRTSRPGDARHYHSRLSELRLPTKRFGRQPIGQYQSFDGQILNDMLIDSNAMAELQELHHLKPHERMAALIPMMRQRPYHIPTANMITTSLREGGYLSGFSAEAGDNTIIPKVISQYWNSPSVPDDVLSLSKSWQDCNLGWSYRRFDDEAALQYLKSRFSPLVVSAYQRAADSTTRADLLRLAVLTSEGGVWADMDDRCRRPLESSLPSQAEVVFWQEPTGHIGNNFMAARAHHPVLQQALVLAVNAINRGDRDKVWMLTGPGLLTRAFALVLANMEDTWRDWLKTIVVTDEFELWQQIAYHCSLSYKLQGRHWSKTTFTNGSRAIEKASIQAAAMLEMNVEA